MLGANTGFAGPQPDPVLEAVQRHALEAVMGEERHQLHALERVEVPLVLGEDRDVERDEHLVQLAVVEEEEPALVLAALQS